MSLRKFQADELFTGKKMLPGNYVLICDNKGIVKDIVDETEAVGDIQRLTGILAPGFINCHCHLELSHMRGLIPEKTGLIDFVFAVVTQRHYREEEILDAIAQAEDEMIANGIIAVGDICNNLHTLIKKEEKNLRYYNFIETSGWVPAIAQQRFLRSKQYYEFYSEIFPSSIVPHAPYSVSDELWQLIVPYFESKVASIHNQETAFEDELFLQNTGDFVRMYEKMKIDHSFYQPSGKTSLQSYFSKLQSADQILLVHNTFSKEDDIVYIQKAGGNNVSFCLCVNANQYIEQSLPPVDLLRKHGCEIVLGTDSLASNGSLSILNEIKTIQKNFPSVPLEEMLRWATFNGAKALQMDGELGSFEKGKQPGVNILKHNLKEIKRLL